MGEVKQEKQVSSTLNDPAKGPLEEAGNETGEDNYIKN